MEKTSIYYLIKVISEELNLISLRNENKLKIVELKSCLDDLKNDNEQMLEIRNKFELEKEEIIKKKEILESDLNNENLQDLINKHNLLKNELKQIDEVYNQYSDSNYIFQKLSHKEPFYLAQFMKSLNTSIIEKMKVNN